MFPSNALVVGYGEADLEAPLNGSMPGYFGDRKATATHDPLLAKALLLKQGKTSGLLIALDLIALEAEEVAQCRKAVEAAVGVPSGHVWIHATHTHTGMMIPRRFTSDAQAIVSDFYPGTEDPVWTTALPQRVAAAASKAVEQATESEVTWGEALVPNIAFYRRFRMKDGTLRTNPGRKNPEIESPAGNPDPRVTVLQFPGSRALLVVFGVHPDVIGGTEFSADYPYFLTKHLKERFGEDWNVLFLNAASGNINHVNVDDEHQGGGFAESERIGRAIGQGVIEAVGQARPLATEPLRFASQRVESRLRAVPEEVVQEAERVLKEDPASALSFNGLFAPAALVLGRTADRSRDTEVSAMRLGEFALVGLPGEIFVELARRVMHDSPFDSTRVIGLTNGSLGYIPDRTGYDQGGYEAGYRSARFTPGTGELWADTAIRLLRDLQSP